MVKRSTLAIAFALVSTIAADAQNYNQPVLVQGRNGGSNAIRVQTGTSFFVPGPTGETEDATKNRERARRAIYEMAAHECELLLQVLAQECRLESITVNVNRQFGQQVEGYTAMGNMTFQITLKSSQ